MKNKALTIISLIFLIIILALFFPEYAQNILLNDFYLLLFATALFLIFFLVWIIFRRR